MIMSIYRIAPYANEELFSFILSKDDYLFIY